MQREAKDASIKVEQLRNDISFNHSVTETLVVVSDSDRRIGSARNALAADQLEQSIMLFDEVVSLIESINLSTRSPVMGILSGKTSTLRRDIISALKQKWNLLVRIDTQNHEIKIVADDSGGLSFSLLL